MSNYPAHLAAALGGEKVGDKVGEDAGKNAGANAGKKLTDNQRRILLLLTQNNRLSAPLSA